MSRDDYKGLSSKFKTTTQSPSFSAWANMQQNELNERAGDGYSPWEYAIDSVKGIPEIVRRQATDWYSGGTKNTEPQNQLLDKMRAISDKGEGYKTTPQESDTVNSWNQLMMKGKTPGL